MIGYADACFCTEHGDPMGIEITAPGRVTPATLNAVLGALGQQPPTEEEFDTDGRRLFFTVGWREADIWVMELEGLP